RRESNVVVLAESGEVAVDQGRAHVDRRWLCVLEVRPDPGDDLIQLGSFGGEIQPGEVLVVEQPAGDRRRTERSAQRLAVVEGKQVRHRVLRGFAADAGQLPAG